MGLARFAVSEAPVISAAVNVICTVRVLPGKGPVAVRPREVLVGLVWFALVGLIGAVYVLTPHDLVFHMSSSMSLLPLLLPHMTLFVLCVFRLDALRETFARA